jgi:hypothetical protein
MPRGFVGGGAECPAPRTGENPGFDFIQGIGARPAPGSSSASSTARPLSRTSVLQGAGTMTHVPIKELETPPCTERR